jgi:hypothetical protein
MHYIYEQLVNDHIRELHEAAAARPARRARRTGQPTHVGRLFRRISHLTRRPTPVRSAPAHTLDATTSTT